MGFADYPPYEKEDRLKSVPLLASVVGRHFRIHMQLVEDPYLMLMMMMIHEMLPDIAIHIQTMQVIRIDLI